MSVTNASGTQVFSAGGHRFTWVEVIEAARARGDWAALHRHVVGLLAREGDLSATGGLPTAAQVRAAGHDFRYQRNLLSADELVQWLDRRDVTLDEWKSEMRRSLLEPLEHASVASPELVERMCWVHAVCSGKLPAFARKLAEEVAVHLSEAPLTLAPDELAGLAEERERFCRAQLSEPALAAEVDANKVGWTRIDFRCLIHPDEMVVREAALCVRLDGRQLADVAADAGARLNDMSQLTDDIEPQLRTRLVAADAGNVVGPLAVGMDHWLVLIVQRVPPDLDDPLVRARAEKAIIKRALAFEVNRQVNWHEFV